MSTYKPTTESIRDYYVFSREHPDGTFIASQQEHEAEFDRWLNKVKADVIREAAEEFSMGGGLEAFAVANVSDDVSAVRATSTWLDERADLIERGEA